MEKINCEVCGKEFSEADKFTACASDAHKAECPIAEIGAPINAADGRQLEGAAQPPVDNAHVAPGTEKFSEADIAAHAAADAKAARIAELDRIHNLCPRPTDTGIDSSLVQVTVKGNGEDLTIKVGEVEVPRGFPVMVPRYIAESLADAHELA